MVVAIINVRDRIFYGGNTTVQDTLTRRVVWHKNFGHHFQNIENKERILHTFTILYQTANIRFYFIYLVTFTYNTHSRINPRYESAQDPTTPFTTHATL